MKRRILRLLDRAGLVGPAFRLYERIVSLRPGRPHPVDGPPLPPRRLMVRVAGTADAEWFLRSGRAAYDAIAAHVPLAEVGSVLDFGCGCGRVTRYWEGFPGAVAGSDVNAKAVQWCRENLGFARFERNALSPPLAFDGESFDLVYALSVFTHLTAELQLAWRDEMLRVLRPGGLLLLTTHGRSYVPRLDEDERARFERGDLVVRWSDVPGTNLCSAYHPEAYLRDTFAGGFSFLLLDPEGARGNPTQDLVLLRKD
ncbi:MAG TPA: methyltransferase domain-containing protein [Gaiellaceae bacterium]|nr:methyltransferase domain-containing protein [Gaiellaceae bacterium]